MTALVLALVIGAPLGAESNIGRFAGAVCSVSVFALDPQGGLLSSRTGSASRTPAMLFRGRSVQLPEGSPPLLFDVFNPRGQRYAVLLGTTRGRPLPMHGRSRSLAPTAEAGLAVAGSSIAWTSMYGRWRVEPRFEGQDSPCGPARPFRILP